MTTQLLDRCCERLDEVIEKFGKLSYTAGFMAHQFKHNKRITKIQKKDWALEQEIKIDYCDKMLKQVVTDLIKAAKRDGKQELIDDDYDYTQDTTCVEEPKV